MPTERRLGAALDRLAPQLDQGEQVVTAGEAVFQTQRRSGRGFVVLTDQRVIWVNRGLHDGRMVELPLSAISGVERGPGSGRGDAERGDLTINLGGARTHLARIRPSECADAIASYIRRRITGVAR